ncbi:diaminohydroxyphosphoribosylaminopyrimidine deaminase [Prosthecobacter fusiformis]|uniref:Diaminohydroxyphosphoribosylaminopyrimidine deaminase n=1 Tax=Prosthecobacter fusiformis TaxID=48464 RepID=A0A4R7SP80_9BACT|nr:methyltransferase domain-containing protein [Prosthecobacter fusiformis]TDU80801.1 diaminohydroxyphosphoribosylaminopyrimidine deaminase [Prosthecobacter fusiformis]
MLKPEKLYSFMKMAISESRKSKPEDGSIHPKVGAVIVDENGTVVAKAHRGEQGRGDHAEFIAISKAIQAGFKDFSRATIFATLEPCTHRGHGKTPCAERIVNTGFGRIYIGALDPNPVIVGHGETFLRMRQGLIVERFPSELERQIREDNREFWNLFSSAHLPSTSLYIQVRVSDVILSKLRSAGVDIDHIPTEDDYSLRDLASYVYGRGKFHSKTRKEILDFLVEARSSAFDQKYSSYTYDQDARKIEERWKKEFPGILKRFKVYDFPKRRILNVGIGNGLEGVGLFEHCINFTGVDIAPESLTKAQTKFPRATFIKDSAESLDEISDQSQDIYVSLRTYQSAFFDIQESVRQAYRVLAPGGIFIASIANAYVEGNVFVRGLLPHGSKNVDQDCAPNLANAIRHILTKHRFDDVGVHSGKAEEYVFGRKRYH